MPAEPVQAAGHRIGALLQAAVGDGAVAGAVALVAQGADAHVEAAGRLALGHPAPMREDAIFRIMSMTKPITAAAAMMLVEDGRIALHDPVERFLPELADRRVLRHIGSPVDDTVPAKRAITVEDLLTLRPGLGIVMAPPGRYPIQAEMEALGVAPGADPVPFSPDEFMARIGRLPLLHQPGEAWAYHIGADILAVLIARVAGAPLADVLDERVFAPLGMRDTGFSVQRSDLDRLPAAYAADAAGLQEREPQGGGPYAAPPAFPSELVSTAADYLRFASMLLAGGQGQHGRLLSAASVRRMMTDQVTPEQKAVSPFFPGFWDRYGWGYGGGVTVAAGAATPVGAYGWSGGYGTSFAADPGSGRIGIVLTQRLMQSAEDMALTDAVQRAAFAGI